MKKGLLGLVLCAVMVTQLTGCAGVGSAIYTGGAPTSGMVFTNVTAPAMNLQAPISANAKSSKVGMASAISILGIVGVGDASIDEAMRNGGITKIHHVDHNVMSILGVFSKWTLIVHGE